MNMSFHPRSADWRLMATIEVGERAPDLAAILADLRFDFRLDPAVASPPGRRWFHLFVDACRGEQRCARSAHTLLHALQRIAQAGELADFRIVAGERWLNDPTEAPLQRTAGDAPPSQAGEAMPAGR